MCMHLYVYLINLIIVHKAAALIITSMSSGSDKATSSICPPFRDIQKSYKRICRIDAESYQSLTYVHIRSLRESRECI